MAGRHIFKELYVQVILAVIVGVALGVAWPELGVKLKPLGDGFVKLIKMMIAPIVFLTVTLGIGKVGDLRKIGSVGLKALIYFEALTTVALLIGLVVVNLLQPGAGIHADPKTLELISSLGGEVPVPMVSHNVPSPLAALAGKGFASTTHSYTWRRRLPVDAVSEGEQGTALCHESGKPLRYVMTVPWDQVPEWARRGAT